MFRTHISNQLSAYCNDELPADESKRVAEHLLVCDRCHREYDAIKLGVSLASRLTPVSAPASMWAEIDRALHRQMERTRSRSLGRMRAAAPGWRIAWAALVILIVAGIGFVWYHSRSSNSGLRVASLHGAPRVGSQRVVSAARLAVGQWLETDGESRARINVGLIGEVEVESNTVVRLVESRATKHRLALERGKLRATIWAPPKLFFVDTPSAQAIDYGCQYTLEVDQTGRSLLRVTLGWVALVLGGRESMVPAGAVCETRPGIGPGTPYSENASAALRGALARFDFDNGGTAELETILAEARGGDALTLWYLLSRVDATDRARVYDTLGSLLTPPEEVTREGILRLDRKMLDRWKDKIDYVLITGSSQAR